MMLNLKAGLEEQTEIPPVSISVYDRFDHFKRCIESLQQDRLAKRATVYIYSDAPKAGDEEKIQRVRDYAVSLNGFKMVHLRFQAANGYKENMRAAREEPLKDYGWVIRMEDDVVVSPNFLTFMAYAMNFYKTNNKVYCVSAWTPPVLEDMNYNRVMAGPILNASGVGLFKEKYHALRDWAEEMHPYLRIAKDLKLLVKVCVRYGVNWIGPLRKAYFQDAFLGDYFSAVYMTSKSFLTIFPPRSLSHNYGDDGTGYHASNKNTDLFPVRKYYADRLRAFQDLPKLDFKEPSKSDILYWMKMFSNANSWPPRTCRNLAQIGLLLLLRVQASKSYGNFLRFRKLKEN